MGKSVHTGRSGGFLRQVAGQRRVKDSISGDQAQIHDSIFVVGLLVGYNGGDGGLRACARRGGNCNEGGYLVHDLEQSRHLVDGGVGMHDSCRSTLCRVHGRAAADGEETVAAGLEVHLLNFINDLDCGVGGDLGIVLVCDTGLIESFLGNGGDSPADGAAGNYHDFLDIVLLKKLGSLVQSALTGDGYRLAPVQKACTDVKNRLKGAVISFFQTIHMYVPLSKLICTFYYIQTI